jgi:hypothetical protein
MKMLLIPLAGALAAAVSPAAAQGRLTTAYVDSLEWKIDNAAQAGALSHGQANRLRSELHEAQPLAWRVETGQARGYERHRLQGLVSDIEGAVSRVARYDAPRYTPSPYQAPGFQYGQGYDRYGGWAR